MSKIYYFSVKCEYRYEIQACDEETARKILRVKGGLEIQGEPVFLDDAYKEAELVEVTEVKKEDIDD